MASNGGVGLVGSAIVSHQEELPHGIFMMRAVVVARDPCPIHGYAHWDGPDERGIEDGNINRPNPCEGGIIGVYDNPADISVKALAQLMQVNILALSGQSITNVSNSSQAISVADVPSAPFIVAGLTGTAATFADYALGDGTSNTNYHANSSYAQAATVNAIASNTFTVTATITNSSGGNLLYKEIGLAVTVTHSASPYYFLLCHDQVNSGSGYTVSNSGTLSVTYTGTFT